jgi:hypothetical protein
MYTSGTKVCSTAETGKASWVWDVGMDHRLSISPKVGRYSTEAGRMDKWRFLFYRFYAKYLTYPSLARSKIESYYLPDHRMQWTFTSYTSRINGER